MVIQKIKSLGIKLVLSAALAAAPLAALGGISHADGTVNWTGNGADSVKACKTGQTPYLHWIFTTGGNDSVTAANLTVGGNASGSGAMTQHGNGSWTRTTSYSGTGQPTTSTVSAHVTYTGSLGNGQANLVISDGCFGSGGSGGGGGGGGGGTSTTTGGQVLGATGQSQFSQVPVGSANGGGGGISDFSLTSLARDW